jgi:hypothetical protein
MSSSLCASLVSDTQENDELRSGFAEQVVGGPGAGVVLRSAVPALIESNR